MTTSTDTTLDCVFSTISAFRYIPGGFISGMIQRGPISSSGCLPVKMMMILLNDFHNMQQRRPAHHVSRCPSPMEGW